MTRPLARKAHGWLTGWLRFHRRGQAGGLARLDDHLLRDIGLTRSQAEELSR
jgi:uncharacterized protein YjiS (DUF1127 family)